jgi:adenylylsulfate kinase-like enzyme
VASALATHLADLAVSNEIIDHDQLGYKSLHASKIDRDDKAGRIGYVASLLNRYGVVALVVIAFSPSRGFCEEIHRLSNRVLEVYDECSIEAPECCDVNGLYRERLAACLEMSGISSFYECPGSPDVRINSELQSEAICICVILHALCERNWLEGYGLHARGKTCAAHPSSSVELLSKAVTIVHERYRDSQLSLEMLSRVLGVFTRYLGRLFATRYSMTFRQ